MKIGNGDKPREKSGSKESMYYVVYNIYNF